MTLLNRLILPALLLAASASCARGNKAPESTEAVEIYPLPSVPATVTEPHERASIICARFWDDARFPSEATDSVSPALEQAMANFAAIATMASEPDSVRRGVAEMIRKGGRDYIMPLAERYLYDPNSPLRSEETFLMFLDAAPDWERTALLRPEVMKNRVGSRAADFEFTDSRGRRGTLSAFVRSAGGPVMVYFFDSECNVCKDLIPVAEEAAGDMAVIAICPEANAAKFDEVTGLFPARWTVGRDGGAIDSEELYVFPALPSAYVIDADMTVLAKDLRL